MRAWPVVVAEITTVSPASKPLMISLDWVVGQANLHAARLGVTTGRHHFHRSLLALAPDCPVGDHDDVFAGLGDDAGGGRHAGAHPAGLGAVDFDDGLVAHDTLIDGAGRRDHQHTTWHTLVLQPLECHCRLLSGAHAGDVGLIHQGFDPDLRRIEQLQDCAGADLLADTGAQARHKTGEGRPQRGVVQIGLRPLQLNLCALHRGLGRGDFLLAGRSDLQLVL